MTKKKSLSIIEVIISIIILSITFMLALNIIAKNNKILKDNNSFYLEDFISTSNTKNLIKVKQKEESGNYYDKLKDYYLISDNELKEYLKHKKYSFKRTEYTDENINNLTIEKFSFANGKNCYKINF